MLMVREPPGSIRSIPRPNRVLGTAFSRTVWASGWVATGMWAARLGVNLRSSPLRFDESGEPLRAAARKQIEAYRQAWKEPATPTHDDPT